MEEKIDIKDLEIPNICFSLTGKDDHREEYFKKQRIERGFDDSETWSLCDTITCFIIPRLERFIEINSNNRYIEKYEKILVALKLIERDDGMWIFTEEEQRQLEEGLKLFPEYFMHMWW